MGPNAQKLFFVTRLNYFEMIFSKPPLHVDECMSKTSMHTVAPINVFTSYMHTSMLALRYLLQPLDTKTMKQTILNLYFNHIKTL